MKKKLLYLPLICSILSVVVFLVRNLSFLKGGDREGFLLYLEDMWEGSLIVIVLSILLIILGKLKSDKKLLFGIGLGSISLVYLITVLSGLVKGLKAASFIEISVGGKMWLFLYDINPCYELILKLPHRSILVDGLLILQCILIIVAMIGVVGLSFGMYYLEKVEDSLDSRVESITAKVPPKYIAIAIVIGLIIGTALTMDGGTSERTCQVCGRSYEKGSSNSTSIRKTNMCTNCYDNYKFLDSLGY